MEQWTTQESESLYNVSNWGSGFFGINDRGHVEVLPEGRIDPDAGQARGPRVDLYELVEQIQRRGVRAPLLIRFDGILRSRVRQLWAAFDRARNEYGYEAPYRGVFPIKVNQERHVVEALLAEGRAHGLGLEVGSKPELFAGIALELGEDSLMICNGYKDREYVEMALLASQLGITPVLVIEKRTELTTILEASDRLGIRPVLGVRSKLLFRSSGRWQQSVGDRSKFGLTTREIVDVVETLRARDMLDCLGLLHFHIGSQITHIRSIKQAMGEATNLLVGLSRMGVHIRWFDVGGGLGVDYDGSRTNFDSSMNYTLQEYANDVVYHIYEACQTADLPQPIIVSESGRALVAHHAVLVGEVIGVSSVHPSGAAEAPRAEEPSVVHDMAELVEMVSLKNYQECYHDAHHLRDQAMLLFNTGQLELPDRARVEEFFWRTCKRILNVTRQVEYVPEELGALERELADTYFVNFSLFQSIPDSWAIQHVFPIMPLARLGERPTRRAVLADMTCDSDGKIDRFIDLRDVKRTLDLHEVDSEACEHDLLGFFLVGAYQEILGDMHNLFGDTNVVHVDVDEHGQARLEHVIRGDRVKDVLSYVEYFEDDLLRNLRKHVESALKAGRMDYEESALFWRRYEEGLRGDTYLATGGGNRKTAPRVELTATTPNPNAAHTSTSSAAASDHNSHTDASVVLTPRPEPPGESV